MSTIVTTIVTIVCLIGLGAVVCDIFVTVFKSGSDGFLAYRITNTIWSGALALHRRRESHRFLSNVGVGLVAVLPLIWLSFMWVFWSLLFLVHEGSVLNATTQQPSDGWSKVYFAGYSLFTSGLGDHVPGASLWQIATVVTTAMGLGLVTLAVTFLVPVLQAANARRSCARSISRLGTSPDALSADIDLVEASASSISTAFAEVAEQHISYPMLDHLHTQNEDNSLAVQLDHLQSALGDHESVDSDLQLLGRSLDDLVAAITPELEQGGIAERISWMRKANGWASSTE